MVRPEGLSDTFVLIIQEWLTDNELSELRKKNDSLKSSDVCASHDFCDPNQAMINALEKHGVSLDIQDENQLSLINQAWNIAKENEFMTRLQILSDMGFPMLADWIEEDEIGDLQTALNHLEDNKYMMDDEEDKLAFRRAEEIVRGIFETN